MRESLRMNTPHQKTVHRPLFHLIPGLFLRVLVLAGTRSGMQAALDFYFPEQVGLA